MQEIPVYDEVEGLIFDLDGTLADTMPAHFMAWRETCKKYGIEFTKEIFMELAGVPLYATVRKLNEQFGKNLDPEIVGKEKENKFLETINQTRVIEPVADVVRKYHGILPMSVGTGGHREVAEQTLRITGMDEYFDILVTADDVTRHKPLPDTFLECARQMHVQPEACQVFEDGKPGFEAAKNAGMKLVDVTRYYEVTMGQ
ncbi:MAG: HAD family hydrolase [Bacteroidota bacterium]